MRSRIEAVPAIDEKGHRVDLVRIVSQILSRSLDGDSWEDGLASMKTQDGEQCTPIGNGVYEAIHTRRRFTLADESK